MKRVPREILVVHTDTTSRVSRYLVGHLEGREWPVSRRNIRYSYAPTMYHMVILIGVKDVPASPNTLFFEYTPYRDYDRLAADTGKMSVREYQLDAAANIALQVVESLSTLS